MPVPGGSDDGENPVQGVSPVEIEATILDTAVNILDHQGKGIGNVPAGLLGTAKEHMSPSKVPWQTVLGKTIRRAKAWRSGYDDTTFQRPNRRRQYTMLGDRKSPNRGLVRPVPQIILIRDTSGSMGQADLAAVSRECEAIAKRMGIRGDDFRVVDADTHIYDVKKYQGRKTMEQVTGRGGTDMARAIEQACNLKPRPHVVICATDGGTGWPNKMINDIPVVAVVVTDNVESPWCCPLPEWIKTVVVDREELTKSTAA